MVPQSLNGQPAESLDRRHQSVEQAFEHLDGDRIVALTGDTTHQAVHHDKQRIKESGVGQDHERHLLVRRRQPVEPCQSGSGGIVGIGRGLSASGDEGNQHRRRSQPSDRVGDLDKPFAELGVRQAPESVTITQPRDCLEQTGLLIEVEVATADSVELVEPAVELVVIEPVNHRVELGRVERPEDTLDLEQLHAGDVSKERLVEQRSDLVGRPDDPGEVEMGAGGGCRQFEREIGNHRVEFGCSVVGSRGTGEGDQTALDPQLFDGQLDETSLQRDDRRQGLVGL